MYIYNLQHSTQLILNIFCGLVYILAALQKSHWLKSHLYVQTDPSKRIACVHVSLSIDQSDLEPFDNQWASNDEDDDQDVVEKSYLGKKEVGRFLSLRFFLKTEFRRRRRSTSLLTTMSNLKSREISNPKLASKVGTEMHFCLFLGIGI